MTYFHVIASAGHDRPVFDDGAVVQDVYSGLAAVVEVGVEVGAYAIMTAHAHVLLGLNDPGALGSAVQRILGPTAQNYNRRVQQRGSVFVRKFWRSNMTSEAYLWTLPLYMHSNLDPAATDPARLDVGLRSSHAAFVSGDLPKWLSRGVVYGQYGGEYAAAMGEYVANRAELRTVRAELGRTEECVLVAVAKATGVQPATLLDTERGGKRDRMLLAWALDREIGAVDTGRVLGVTRQTVARWVDLAEADVSLAPARLRLGM